MRTPKFKSLFAFALVAIVFTACKSDDDSTPPPGTDEELITDLILTFTDPEGAMPTRTFTWSDPDGPGGNAPTIDIIGVEEGFWVVTIQVLDASNPNDVDDITEEIEEEDDEHQFFFELLNGADQNIAIFYADEDENEQPVGLKTNWLITGPVSGNQSVRITLIHEPNKKAPGASEGILSSEVGGEIDIEVEFPIQTL